jgi:glutathione S-transferase
MAGFELRYGWLMNLRRPGRHKPLRGRPPSMNGASHPLAPVPAAHGAGGPFLFGHFTAADAICAGGDALRHLWRKLDDDIRAYVDAVFATPAMKQWYAEVAKEPWPEPRPTSE